MLILIDNPQLRSRLIANVQRRMDKEIDQVAAEICAGRTGERPLRRLQTLTRTIAAIEAGTETS